MSCCLVTPELVTVKSSRCLVVRWHQNSWPMPWTVFYTQNMDGILYPELSHRQGGCLACCGCTFESRPGCTDLYYARGAQGVLPMRVIQELLTIQCSPCLVVKWYQNSWPFSVLDASFSGDTRTRDHSVFSMPRFQEIPELVTIQCSPCLVVWREPLRQTTSITWHCKELPVFCAWQRAEQLQQANSLQNDFLVLEWAVSKQVPLQGFIAN